jgi:hypothetical protein
MKTLKGILQVDRLLTYLFLALSIMLMWQYRGNPGDIELYSEAGRKILAGINPYINSEYANSPVAAVLIYYLSLAFTGSLFVILIQALNIVGLLAFLNHLKTFFRMQSASSYALLILSATISFRALIANVQVTGILLGLFVLATSQISKMRGKNQYLGYCAAFLALELKPQVVLPLFLILFLTKNRYLPKAMAMLTFLACHVAVSTVFGSLLEPLWLEKISTFSNKSFLIGPEISLWKVPAHFLGDDGFVKHLSSLTLLLFYLILLILIIRKNDFTLIFALCGPLIGSYSHMYDLVGIFLTLIFLSKRKPSFRILVVSIFAVPVNSRPIFVILLVLLILCINQFAASNRSLKFKKTHIFWATFSMATILIANFLAPDSQELSLSIRLLVLVFGLVALKKQPIKIVRRKSALNFKLGKV